MNAVKDDLKVFELIEEDAIDREKWEKNDLQ